jgi:hypothetical protein
MVVAPEFAFAMEVDFWGVKSSGCEISHAISEMLKHSSEKLNFIPKKKRKERQSHRNPKFSGYHSSFPSRNDFLIKVLSQYRCR